jgi:hypothetical protein
MRDFRVCVGVCKSDKFSVYKCMNILIVQKQYRLICGVYQCLDILIVEKQVSFRLSPIIPVLTNDRVDVK